jgi:hypothetical protein
MNKRVILTVVLSTLCLALIALFLTVGNSVTVPTLPTMGSAENSSPFTFPKGASASNYTVLCVKRSDAKVKFSKTGPYATCPRDFATVPAQFDPKQIRK